MAYILGYSVGFWCLYAVLALVFKHKVGLVISGFVCLLSSVLGNVLGIIACVASIVLIYAIVPLQVKSEKKEQWKQGRVNKK